jgi:hypothetical protein
MPNALGLCSGTVPFVCRLFPRQPGYVMTVCAWAIDMAATKARSVRRAYMVDVSVLAARIKTMSGLTKSKIRKGELQRCYVPSC